MIIFNYDENKIDDLRNKLGDKYKLEKWLDGDFYMIRNELYKKEDTWFIFYEDLYNVFKL
jgi:hypothetical protein